MVFLYIILRNLTLVFLLLFGEKVRGVDLLQQCIALVLLIAQDASDRGTAPVLFSTRCWNSKVSPIIATLVLALEDAAAMMSAKCPESFAVSPKAVRASSPMDDSMMMCALPLYVVN